MKIISIFFFLYSNLMYAQQIEMDKVLEDIFCKYQLTSTVKIISLVENQNNIFKYTLENDQLCVTLKFFKDEKTLLKFLRKEKKIYYIDFSERLDSKNNEKFFTFKLYEINIKGNKKKINLKEHLDDYIVSIRLNESTNVWELNKVIYPTRMQSIINKKMD